MREWARAWENKAQDARSLNELTMMCVEVDEKD